MMALLIEETISQTESQQLESNINVKSSCILLPVAALKPNACCKHPKDYQTKKMMGSANFFAVKIISARYF